MVVIGRIRAGRQDFKSEVGMGSREQVALDEEEIAIVIYCLKILLKMF